MAVADLNGDHKCDIVVANTRSFYSGNSSVGVLLSNGDGTFQPVITYDSGATWVYSVAVADVNWDGKLDLVASNRCADSCINPDIMVNPLAALADDFGRVSVLLGNGNGTFQAAVTYTTGGYEASAVAVRDVNGDGKPDVLVTDRFTLSSLNGDGGDVGVLLGNGDGSFQAPVNYRADGEYTQGIAIADVNGDGKPDLLAANRTRSPSRLPPGNIGVLLGNGDGTFQPVVTYDAGGYGSSVAVADLNGDRKPDLVVANQFNDNPNYYNGSVSVLLGNGNGTFQSALSYGPGGNMPIAAVAADVNGDGKPDLVLANECSSTTNCNYGAIGVLINREATTYSTLINAVKEDVDNRIVAHMIVATLKLAENEAAKGHRALANLLLKDFINEVKTAKRAKLITAATAAILIREANALMRRAQGPKALSLDRHLSAIR